MRLLLINSFILCGIVLGQTPSTVPLRLIDSTHAPFDLVSISPSTTTPPQPIFDVRKYGAVGDGVTYDTAAIQKTIDAATGTGGSVYLAGGRFLTAPLVLKGGLTFYLNQDAVLLGSTRPGDYPDLMPPQTAAQALRKSLLFAYGADHLTLEGGGEINGQGQQLLMTGKEPFRPSLLRIFGSDDVTVRNLTLRNPRMWTQIYSECTHLTLDHLQVDSPRGYCPNLDGMDICDSAHVVISNCHVESQDDGICLKSHGPRGLQDITVKNNIIRDFDANGIKLGTATNGPIDQITIENNLVLEARFAGLCLESVDGAQVNNITVRGLDLQHVAQPIYIRLAHRRPPPNDLQFASMQPRPIGSIDHVMIEDVRSIEPDSKTVPSNTITGVPDGRLGHILIRNAYFAMPGGCITVPPQPGEHDGQYPQSNILGLVPGYAFYVRHAEAVIFDHVTVVPVKPDVRPWLAKDDATVTTTACQELQPLKP